ncbi:hypothetical protein SLS53_000726 [Cytospora paraplurivora]|uniref:histidine kinase n=1 Tax=Cytospora paraplurivora TaxID=2898453 RepID=A0AAN9UI10_9PEZI
MPLSHLAAAKGPREAEGPADVSPSPPAPMTEHDFEQLTNAGVCVFDLNAEYLAKKDWSNTALGPTDRWSQPLSSYVSLIKAMPHPAAVFWGPHLAIAHNNAWGSAAGPNDIQGAPATDWCQGEARGSLQSALTGRTVRLLHSEPRRRSLDNELLGNGPGDIYRAAIPQKSQNNEALDKSEQDQEDIINKIASLPSSPHDSGDERSGHGHMDSKQSQLFQRFAELLPTGLAILDHNAEAVFVNDQFFHLTTKKSSHEFRSWPESIDPRDYNRVMTQYREAFGKRQEIKVEFRCVINDDGENQQEDASGNSNWRMFLLKPLDVAKNSGYICAVVDISELKIAEKAQERAAEEAKQRKQQQERFIDMVSHEIRNPLSAVLHLAEEIKQTVKSAAWLESHSDEAGEIIDAADTILICVSHQSVLVDDILAFSKVDSMMLSLAPSVSQPQWTFSKQLKVFQAELKSKRIAFEYALDVSVKDFGVDWVVADLARMKQVLVNLMTNAIKFTARKNGERRITVAMGASIERPTSYPPNVVFFEAKDNAFHVDQTQSREWGDGEVMYLMIVVKDTGIGISADNQVKLFERFRQATPKTSETYGGSGLGLSIARKLCQLHGGDIGVASKEGQGSTFGFYFRVRRASPPAEEDGTASGRSTPRRQLSSEKSSILLRPRIQSRQNSQKDPVDNADEAGEGNKKDQPTTSSLDDKQRGPDTNRTLDKPPVRYEPEAHPGSRMDDRASVSDKIANEVNKEEEVSTHLDDGEGETRRQARLSDKMHDAQGLAPMDTKGILLLVEDNMINQKVLKRQLQNHDWLVFTANNGQEAVDAVIKRAKDARSAASSSSLNAKPQHESLDNRFSCILMDQEMPIKDGNTAAREIKDLQEKGEVGRSPILGVSANVRAEQMESMRNAGMDDVISKPFKVVDLVKKIKSLAEKDL